MAEYTAIVEAANALVELLRDALTPEPIAKKELISLCSPHNSEDNQLTISVFHVEDDPNNSASGYYQVTPELQRMRPTVLQLYLLITAHSKAPAQLREADQCRIIGRVVQVLRDHPKLEKKYLSGSLLETGSRPMLVLQKPAFEQMLKIWNNQAAPYKLSVVCQMSGIEIDSRRTREVSRVTDVEIDVRQKGRQP